MLGVVVSGRQAAFEAEHLTHNEKGIIVTQQAYTRQWTPKS